MLYRNNDPQNVFWKMQVPKRPGRGTKDITHKQCCVNQKYWYWTLRDNYQSNMHYMRGRNGGLINCNLVSMGSFLWTLLMPVHGYWVATGKKLPATWSPVLRIGGENSDIELGQLEEELGCPVCISLSFFIILAPYGYWSDWRDTVAETSLAFTTVLLFWSFSWYMRMLFTTNAFRSSFSKLRTKYVR